mmetsp:Transcript_117897/g.229224  ORF Transcript_117897/g.229224 Transcript_117897/m.229224 type:complete len:274 (+) Transcript_117897:320-1141(+)
MACTVGNECTHGLQCLCDEFHCQVVDSVRKVWCHPCRATAGCFTPWGAHGATRRHDLSSIAPTIAIRTRLLCAFDCNGQPDMHNEKPPCREHKHRALWTVLCQLDNFLDARCHAASTKLMKKFRLKLRPMPQTVRSIEQKTWQTSPQSCAAALRRGRVRRHLSCDTRSHIRNGLANGGNWLHDGACNTNANACEETTQASPLCTLNRFPNNVKQTFSTMYQRLSSLDNTVTDALDPFAISDPLTLGGILLIEGQLVQQCRCLPNCKANTVTQV